jgi:hypothetical protein
MPCVKPFTADGMMGMKRRTLKMALLILPVLALLGMTIYAAWVAWGLGGDVEMGSHGVVAMVLGVVCSLLLGGILVGLLLYSRRHGHDC